MVSFIPLFNRLVAAQPSKPTLADKWDAATALENAANELERRVAEQMLKQPRPAHMKPEGNSVWRGFRMNESALENMRQKAASYRKVAASLLVNR